MTRFITRQSLVLSINFLLVALFIQVPTQAQLKTEHRRELSALRKDVSKASSLIRRKKLEEAKEAIDKAEEKLKEIMEDAGVDEKDRTIAGVLKAISFQKANLERKMNPGAGKGKNVGISFSKQVAPILAKNCLGCHDDTARGRLRLDTFAGMRQGGMTGQLLAPGNAQRSLLMAKLVLPGQQRMPRGRGPLAQNDLKIIADWINQGARYDQQDPSIMLTNLGKDKPMKKPEIKVAKPDGTETVSFQKDIAPMFVKFCFRCHSGNNPDSGFSVETFENILIGGDSGEVLIPGNLEESRLFRLTGGLENPRMPQGQARITRKNYEDLKAWVKEGIKYDGDDPKIPLREMVPSDADDLAARLQKMSEDEFRQYRKAKAESHWRKTLSSAKPLTVATEKFLLMGNVEESRLLETAKWADAILLDVQKQFGTNSLPAWKGRLAIYVFKDRYDYDEFNRSIENRQPAKTLFGHANVTANFDDAYLAVLDTGDINATSKPSLKWTLAKSLFSAFLQTNAKARPDWLMEGAGWALTNQQYRGDAYQRSMMQSAADVLQELKRPEDLFKNGTFAPDATEHVGYVTTRFLLSKGNLQQFRQFTKMVIDGRDVNDACRAVYNATSANLAQGVLSALR